MKRKFALALVLLFLIGCAASFSQIVYRSQSTSLSSYKIINSVFTDLRANGLISDDGWKKYSDLANDFLDAHKEVSKAMVSYKQGQAPQNTVELAQEFMLLAFQKLKEYYFGQIPPEKQKPLF